MSSPRLMAFTPALAATLFLGGCADRDALTEASPQFDIDATTTTCSPPDVCTLSLDQPASYQTSRNMHLLGFLPRPVPPPSFIVNSDLAFWGRTAFQGTYEGFRVIDISDPQNPVLIRDFADCVAGTIQGNQGDLVVWENVLVRTWNSPAPVAGASCGGQPIPQGFEGLNIFDVSNPANPQHIALVDLPCGSHTATGVPDPANNRLLVYSSGSSGACPWLDIVEVPLADPASSAWLRIEPAGRACHDAGVILGTANLAACAGGDGYTLWSLDAADGGSLVDPAELYSRSLAGVTIGHSLSFTWDGRMLVFGHEPGGGGQAQCQATSPLVNRSIFFFEARTGTQLGSFVMPRVQTDRENCTWHNFNIVPRTGRHIFVSGNYQAGISVVDFTDPANAREIAFADPAPLSSAPDPPVVGGDWSSYWYNGLIYESDMRRGLLVWRLSDPAVAGASRLDHLNPQTQLTDQLMGRR